MFNFLFSLQLHKIRNLEVVLNNILTAGDDPLMGLSLLLSSIHLIIKTLHLGMKAGLVDKEVGSVFLSLHYKVFK